MTLRPDARPAEPSDSPAAQTLPELLHDAAEAAGERLALVAGDTRLTYVELLRASGASARALASIGVAAGDRVALLAPNVAEWVPTAFGILTLGGRIDAFNTWVKAYDLDYLLATSEVSTLVLTDRVRSADLVAELVSLVPELVEAAPGEWRSERFPHLRRVVVIGDDVPRGAHRWSELLAVGGPDPTPAPVDGADAAFVLYTSGSTKNPKAVPLGHRDLVLNGFHIGERMGLSSDDRVWFGSPLFWSFGCANALMATMTHHARFVLQEHFEPREAAGLMAREQVSAAYLLPSMAEALATTCAEEVRAIASLRTGLTIGRRDEVERVAVELGVEEICNVYGATENYGNCCVTDHRMPLARRLETQGEPLPGVEVRIVDQDTGVEVARGVAGEAQVRGRLTSGYLNDDTANAEAFTADGWYRSGDRMVMNDDGTVTFVDRVTDMIKTSGINVSPAEVESFLSTHPDVVETVVVGAPHPVRGEVVVAFVVSSSPSLTADDLIAFCKDHIAGYKVPRLVSIVAELPRTGTGKMSRRTLREPAAALLQDAEEAR